MNIPIFSKNWLMLAYTAMIITVLSIQMCHDRIDTQVATHTEPCDSVKIWKQKWLWEREEHLVLQSKFDTLYNMYTVLVDSEYSELHDGRK